MVRVPKRRSFYPVLSLFGLPLPSLCGLPLGRSGVIC